MFLFIKIFFLILQKLDGHWQERRNRYTASFGQLFDDSEGETVSETNHLVQVKQALAEKYERLSRKTTSRPKKRQFTHRAVKYRRQLAQLQHSAE